ncbi:hypothetical protein EDB83DRAFT_2655717 [Lactarius deliciosus]|nr:hypothetical protein EDB83DRAFT_2655717 [Lactarius deliciosus]
MPVSRSRHRSTDHALPSLAPSTSASSSPYSLSLSLHLGSGPLQTASLSITAVPPPLLRTFLAGPLRSHALQSHRQRFGVPRQRALQKWPSFMKSGTRQGHSSSGQSVTTASSRADAIVRLRTKHLSAMSGGMQSCDFHQDHSGTEKDANARLQQRCHVHADICGELEYRRFRVNVRKTRKTTSSRAESQREATSLARPGPPATVAPPCGQRQLVQASDRPQVPTATTTKATTVVTMASVDNISQQQAAAGMATARQQ